MAGLLLGFVSMAFVLSLIVVFHEFGHYITAKKSGVLVREFALGFGPLLYGKTVGDTHYCVRPIPLGGYVDLAGMDETDELEDPNQAFYSKNPWVKILVLFAGAFMNFVLAFLIFWLINVVYGTPQKPYYRIPVVAMAIPGTPAYEVGLAKGDVIKTVDGQEVVSWSEFAKYVQARPNSPVGLKIDRDGKTLEYKLTTKADSKGKGFLGIMSDTINVAGEVIPDSPAAKANIKSGDLILTIAGEPVKYFTHIEDLLKKHEGYSVELVVFRETSEVKLNAKVDFPEHFGIAQPLQPVIGDIMSGMPAEKAGFKSGDLIVKIDDMPIFTWNQMLSVVTKNAGKEINVTVTREGKPVALKVTPKADPGGDGKIGVGAKTEFGDRMGVVDGCVEGFMQTYYVTNDMIVGIYKLVAGKLSSEYVSGPVGIAKVVKDQATEGFFSLLRITAIISINIGLLNLFPIPGLDGGRIVFVFFEAIRRRRMPSAIEEKIHTAGILLLIVFAIFITYKDILKMFRWS